MTRRTFLAAAAALAGAALAARSAPPPEPKLQFGEREQAAVGAAQAWLALVDAGKYDAAWADAAPLLKDAIAAAPFAEATAAARRPFGALVGRKVLAATFAASLPGAPDGEYVVIQFETRFEKKAAAVETVTPMRAADGRWRVSGYFVR